MTQEIRLRRQRITAPRTVDEAHQMIARIKASFGIEDQEEQLMQLLEAQQAKFDETLYDFTLVTAGAAMKAAGLTTMTMQNESISEIVSADVEVNFCEETKVTTFRLRTPEEVAAWLARPAQEKVVLHSEEDGQAGDESYALPGRH